MVHEKGLWCTKWGRDPSLALRMTEGNAQDDNGRERENDSQGLKSAFGVKPALWHFSIPDCLRPERADAYQAALPPVAAWYS